jgi:hypothetical protein
MRRTWITVLLFLTLPSMAYAEHQTVTFADQKLSPDDKAQTLKIGPATFGGGKVAALKDTNKNTNFPSPWGTHCYWTHNTVPVGIPGGFGGDKLTITFARRASHISFSLGNFLFSWSSMGPLYDPNKYPYRTVRFNITDDHQHQQTVALTGYDPSNYPTPGQTLSVAFPYDNVRSLTISPLAQDTALVWNYAIADVEYEAKDDERIVITMDGDANGQFALVGDDVTAELPLGARFDLAYERRDANGKWNDISSGVEVTDEAVTPRLPATLNDYSPTIGDGYIPLFAGTVLFPFDLTHSGTKKTFQVVHKGDAKLHVKPDDAKPDDDPIAFSVSITDPVSLGVLNAAIPAHPGATNAGRVVYYDTEIVRRAHRSGIPPQWLKAQIDNETGDSNARLFSPYSFRYEPYTRDRRIIQQPGFLTKSLPPPVFKGNASTEVYGDFALPSGHSLCGNGIGRCPSDIDDFAPPNIRQYLYCVNGMKLVVPRFGTYPTARQYILGNPREWPAKADPTPQLACGTVLSTSGGKSHAVRSVQDVMNFTAQTALASSFGLMQAIPSDVMGEPFYWSGFSGLHNPSFLFDTDQNISRGVDTDTRGDVRGGASSLKFGTMRDVWLYRALRGGVDDSPEAFATSADFDDQLANALDLYNGGGAGYGQEVVDRLPPYTPQRRHSSIFTAASCTPPSIAAQTSSVAVPIGSDATLSVNVVGDERVVYDWYADTPSGSVRIGGAAGSIVVRPGTTTVYHAEAVTSCGSVTSAPISVTVLPVCPIPSAPVATVTVGSKVTAVLSVAAPETGTTYGWVVEHDDAAVTDAQSTAEFVASGTSVTVDRQLTDLRYAVVATNACGATASSSVTVPALACPTVTDPTPAAPTIAAGTTIALTVLASAPAPSYQWYVGLTGDTTQPITGANAPALQVSPAVTTSYWVRVTSTCGTADTAPATVTVVSACVPPALTGNAAPTTVAPGGAVTLSASVSGTAPFSVQWYEGAPGDTTHAVASPTATATVNPSVTTMYWAQATNACGTATSDGVTVTVSACPPPTITRPPSGATATAGQTVTLTVEAASGSAGSYQWYIGQSGDTTMPIGGATAPTVSIHPTATTSYWVRVANTCGAADSAAVLVTIIPGCLTPSVTVSPVATSVLAGQSATIIATATGATPLTYQWFAGPLNDTSAPAGSGPTLTVTPAVTTPYWVRVTNTCGTATSSAAVVTVVASCIPPAITQQPLSTVTYAGYPVTLIFNATGTSPLTIAWYVGVSGDHSSPLPGAAGVAIAVAPSDATSYWAEVTNACGSTATVTATVTVLSACAPPTIQQNPVDVTIAAGRHATVSVLAGGSDPLRLQWFTGPAGDESSPIPGGTLSLIDVSPAMTTSYWVEATNDCGIATSAAAVVTVTPACVSPTITAQPTGTTIVAGDAALLQVSTVGTAPVSVQWYVGSSPDTTAPVVQGDLPFVTVTPDGTTSYWARAANACGSVDSAPAVVTVTPACVPPSLSGPASATIVSGDAITLSVAIAGTSPVTQWYVGTTGDTSQPLVGQTTSNLTVTPSVTTSYWARATNACGTADSATATVTVQQPCAPPIVETQPASQTIVTGGSATLSVGASGTAPFSFQWYTGVSGDTSAPIAGAVQNTVSVSPPAATSYWVQVANTCGVIASDTASISVHEPCGGCGPGGGPQPIAGTRLAPPTHVIATARGKNTIAVQWRAGSASHPVLYTVWRATAAGAFHVVGTTNDTAFVNRGLLPRTEYRYFVTATDAASLTSDASNIASAMTR